MAAPASAAVDAGPSDVVASSVADPMEHSHRRLTISNGAATDPTIAFSDGGLHVAWVDHDHGSQRLSYKLSEDAGGSFTSDEPISERFDSMTDISMTCTEDPGDVAIVFSGKSAADTEEGVYLIRSDGDGWGREVLVAHGRSPSMAIEGDDRIVVYTSSDDGCLDIVRIPFEGTEVVGTGLMSIPIDHGEGRVIVHDGIIHHASTIGGTGTIVYGSLSPEGDVIVQPTVIRSDDSDVSSIDIFADGDELTVAATIDGDFQDSIVMMSTVGGGTYWQGSTVLRTDGSLGRIDASPCSEGCYMVVERRDANGSGILGILCDADGDVTESTLSTEGVDARSPALARGPDGAVSSIWVESHGDGSELIMFEDVLCDSCDIDRLIEYVADLDPAMFTEGGRTSLLERLEVIQTAIVDGRDASEPIDALIGDLDGNPSNDGCCQYLLPVDSRSLEVEGRIESNLRGIEGSSIVEGATVRTLSLLSVDDVQATLMGSTDVSVTWSTSLSCRTNRVRWGIDSVDEHIESDTTWYSTDHQMEFRPQENRLIKFMVGSRDTITGEWADGPEMTIFTGVVISDVRVAVNGTDVSVEWSTDHESTCYFRYDDGYSRSVWVSSDTDGLNHSIALTGLDPNTTYQYRIEAHWSWIVSTLEDEFKTSLICIDGLRVFLGDNGSMTFVWGTNVNSTSQLLYGTSTDLGMNVTGVNGTEHSIVVEGLSEGVEYHYRVVSTALCNLSETAVSEGTAMLGAICGIGVVIEPDQQYDDNRAIISWGTWMDCSDNKVTWGTESETATSGTHHTVTLEGLHDQDAFDVTIWSRPDVGSTWMCVDTTVTVDMSITDVVMDATTGSAIITWRTSMAATCTFEYGDDPSLGSQASVQTSDGYSHQVTVHGLDRNSTYHHSISATSVYEPRFSTVMTDSFVTPLMGIHNLSAVSDSIDSINVSWDTEIDSTSILLCGLSYDALDITKVGGNGTHHSLTIRDLTTNTEYAFRAISAAVHDPSVVVSSDGSMTTNIIYDAHIDIVPNSRDDDNEAVVSWRTTVGTDTGEVEYPGGLRSEHDETYHEVTIDHLDDHESFPLTIRSRVDGSSMWHTIVVPLVVNVLVSDIGFNGTATTATIFWETNMDATCTLEYGLNESLGSCASPQTSDGRHHHVSLDSLESGFLYHMRIDATGSRFPARFESSSNGTFHTVVIAITDLIVDTGQAGSMLFTWETNRWSDTIVAYGTSPNDLGNVTQGPDGVEHEILITGLSAGTTIYYTVISTALENASWSDEVEGSCDTSGIVMSDVIVSTPSSGTISVAWDTSCIGTTEVEYWRAGGPVSCATGENGTAHSLTLDGLSPGEVYQLTLRSRGMYSTGIRCEWNGSLRVTIISDIQTTIVPIQGIEAGVYVNWSTSVPCIENRVDYGEDHGVDSNEFDHSVYLDDIHENQIHDLLIGSTVDINGTSVTFEAERQVDVRMVIMDVDIEPHLNSAVIEWSTSIASVCTLRYDLTDPSPGIEVGSSSSDGIHHSVELTGLLSDTEYRFEIQASDEYGCDFECLLDDMSLRTTGFGLSDFEFVSGIDRTQLIWAAISPASVTLELCRMDDGPPMVFEAPVMTMGSICADGLEWGRNYHFKITAVSHDDPELVDVWEGVTGTSPFQTSDVIVSVNGPESVTIEWETNANATSCLMYAPAGQTPIQGNCSDNGTHHSIILDGLVGSTTYQFNITSTAVDRPSFSSYHEGEVITDGYTISGVDTDVLETNPYGTGKAVRVSWATNFNGTSTVDYATERDDFPDCVESVVGVNGTEHVIVLTGLALGRYYFVCGSDPTLHPGMQGASTPTEGLAILDLSIHFGITDVDYEILDATTVRVTWRTDHMSSSIVRVDPSLCPDYFVHGGSNTTDHSVTLTGLNRDVRYTFICYSEWLGSNASSYRGTSFTIELPVSSITVVDQTRTEASIRWVTNWGSSSLVQYAECDPGDAGTVWSTQQYTNATGANGTSHEVRLMDLRPDTVYTFRVASAWVEDPALDTFSSYRSLSTSLTMSNVAVSASVDSITVSWTTNMGSSSVVHYGTTSSYDDDTTGGSGTGHTVTIPNLSSNTIYHVKAVSSIDGTSVESADIEVMTASMSISTVSVVVDCPHQVNITWDTDTMSSTEVGYGTSTSYGTTIEGADGLGHTVVITDLDPGTTYHFRVTSTPLQNPSDVARSEDLQFTTASADDFGSGTDAGDTMDDAIVITPGMGNGTMYSSGDDVDMYWIRLIYGQVVDVDLDVSSGDDIDMSVLTPSGVTSCGSAIVGDANEHLQFRSGMEGLWTIVLDRASGFEAGYSLTVRVDGGFDVMSLDVGSEGDDDMIDNTPGLCIGMDWGSVHDITWREASEGDGLFLNLLEGSYQLNIDYLITIRYDASDDTALQANIGGSWYNVANMPGPSTPMSHSFVLDSAYLTDALPGVAGVNVELRFDHAIEVDTISAVEYSFVSDLDPSSEGWMPCVTLGTGWVVDDGVANATQDATLTVSLPRSDVRYVVEFSTLDPIDGVEVMQLTASGHVTLGVLRSYGGTAAIQMVDDPFDSDGGTIGMDVMLTVSSPLTNVTSIRVAPTGAVTDVGSAIDADPMAVLAATILDDGGWGEASQVDGRTVRYTATDDARFLMNAPVSSVDYIVSIVHGASEGIVVGSYDGSDLVNVSGETIGGGTWCTYTFVIEADDVHDHVPGDEIDVLFTIASQGACIDTIAVSIDSDGDGIADIHEAVGPSPLDRNSVDTDNDGIDDNDELAIGTDPCDADTDDDGLLDGSEQWSQTWSSDGFHQVMNGGGEGNAAEISMSVPFLDPDSDVTGTGLSIGVITDRAQDIRVELVRLTPSALPWIMITQETITIYEGTEDGHNLYSTFDVSEHIELLDRSNDRESTLSASRWEVRVWDIASNGVDGQVRFARMQVSGDTDPNDEDTDGDGILDGEEVELGADGWGTNPVLVDTDGDGIDDHDEVIGSTPCGEPTDPTRRDTDDDGFDDDVDPYMGDMVVEIQFYEYRQMEDINLGSVHDIFFTVNANGHDLATKRKVGVQTSQDPYPYHGMGWRYDIDVYDINQTVDLTFQSWADGGGTAGDDIKLDISSDPGTLDLEVTYDLSSTPLLVEDGGTDQEEDLFNQNSDGDIRIIVSTVVRDRANTILVAGVDDDGVHGLYEVDDGYRYSVDDQLYVIDLNCSDSDSRFDEGMNTILLPRSVAVASYLNDTLMDLGPIESTDPIFGAGFYATDSEVVGSSHVIATIYKDVTAAQAEGVLWMATHDPTGRIGENVTVSSSSLYLMHLPHDVLGAIPTIVENAGMGDAPRYLNIDPFDFFQSVQEFATAVFDLIVGSLTCLWNMATHLVEIGLEFIGDLTAAAASAVHDAVEAIVDAFDAFVDWLVDSISDMLEVLVAEPLQAIQDSMASWASRLVLLLDVAASNIAGGADNASASRQLFEHIVGSDLFTILTAIGISLVVAVTAMQFMGPAGLVSSLVPSLLVDILLAGMVAALFTVVDTDDVLGWVADGIVGILGDDLVGGMANVMGATIGTIGWLASMMYSPLIPFMDGIGGFIICSIGAFLSWYGSTLDDWERSLKLDLFGLALAGYGCWEVFIHKDSPLQDLGDTALGILKGIALIEAGISTLELTTTVASYE